MSTQQDINAVRAQRIANTHDPLAFMANTQTPCHPDHSSLITYIQHPQPNNNFVSQPSFNTNYLQHPMQNPGDISNPTTAFNMALALMAKAFTLNDTTPTNNNQRSSSNPSSMQIAQPGMNMDQDRQMLMVEDIVGNQFRPNAMHNVGNQVVLNASQNPGVQNVGNQNGLSVVSEIANQHGDGNVVTAPAEGNGNGINGNTIRCYNCQGEDHYASNCTVTPRKLDGTIKRRLMIKELNDLQKKMLRLALMQITTILSTISVSPNQPSPSTYMCNKPQTHQQSTITRNQSFNQNYMQQPMPNPEDITDPTTVMNMALYCSPGLNIGSRHTDADCWRKVQTVRNQNPNGNGNVVTARAESNATGNNGNQIRCYNCRGLGHLDRNCTVRPRRRDAAYLQTQLLIAQKEEAGIQLQVEEFDLMAAAVDLDEIEEVNANCILMANLQQASTLGTQTDKALVYDLNGPAENDSNVISEVSSVEQDGGTVDQHPATVEETQEVYFVNTSKTATVSKSISIPNEEVLDDTTLSVARKFLNEVKSTIVTLQRVVKHRMTLDTHNWSSIAHQEIHKILKEEIFPIINQVDTRLQNFEIQFLKEAAKFVRDFKSLAKEADESLAKHKTLELEIERLLRAVVSQDIMSIVQNPSVVDSSNLQTELDRTDKKRT
ncbi:retrovirus-related pol polyprotein from transposon TNT 1-94 [Tanacetum coccineum]